MMRKLATVKLPDPPPQSTLVNFAGVLESVRRADAYRRQMTVRLKEELDSIHEQLNSQIQGIGAILESADSIVPSAAIHHVSGSKTIRTIVAPSGFSGPLFLIADGAWQLATGGNIAVAVTATVNRVMIVVYDYNTAKWYPS
jgi:hypothetical protein